MLTKTTIKVEDIQYKVEVKNCNIDKQKNSSIYNEKNSNNKDNTVATKKLPDTGKKVIAGVSVVLILVCGIFYYKRFKNTIIK